MAKTESSRRRRAKPATGTAASKAPTNNDATIGFEAKLWQAADKLRNNMDAAEYVKGRPHPTLFTPCGSELA